MMVLPKVEFETLLDVVEQLSPEQKHILRQRLDDDWASRFRQVVTAIRADIPADLSEEEINADIEAAIAEVRL
jgi:hypothetical protein